MRFYKKMVMNIKNKVVTLMLLLGFIAVANAQLVVGNGSNGGHYDIDYLTPKKYEIGGITIQGADNLDQRMVLMVADLHVGDKILIPGDKIAGAIDKLWKQGLFDDVKILVANIQNDLVFLNIELVGRPKLSKFQFKGVKKSDADKLRENLNLMVGDVVTENLMITSKNKIISYYLDKGFNNVSVDVLSNADTARKNNEQILVFDVKTGKKVRIKELSFEGNEAISDKRLARTMKKTHDVNYWKKLYFWTSGFWKRSKYIESDFNSDLDEIVNLYNEKGYRDAKIVGDSIYYDNDGKMRVKVNIYEGKPYYFRNITFTGNTIYTSEELFKHLRIEKGSPYNKTTLDQNLSYNPSGTDINSLYMDNGYLFFRATPTEVAVDNDSIDIEIRIREGSQARLNKISLKGNTMTNDKVIMREIHTRPGDLFSRDAVIRSVRELATLQYFDEQKINPDVRPNAENGTVDIEYQLEEKSTSQISLSGGWGSGMIIGTLGLSFNNFSVRNIFNKKAWSPLPTGDGQKLYLSAQTNGTYYYSLSAGFTEPWLGGSKPQSLGFSVYHSLYSNGYYYDKSSPSYYSLRITGAGLSLTKRLSWPDDYFILSQGLTYRLYRVQNYTSFIFPNGYANDINYAVTLSRNSLDSPIYPRFGSELSVGVQLTPPYSLLDGRDYSTLDAQEKYKFLEYYKLNIRGSWMFNLISNVVFNARFRFGNMGYYNSQIGLSPFGRYYVGGDGLSSFALDAREIIPMRGYTTYGLTPQDASGNHIGASMFDKFTLELRQPITLNATATIYVLGFVEGANAWSKFEQFQPFKMYTSAGVGVRLYMPMFGLIGLDWAYGFSDVSTGGSHFHFSINQSID